MILNFLGEYKVTVFVTSWVLGDGFNSGLVKQVTVENSSSNLAKLAGYSKGPEFQVHIELALVQQHRHFKLRRALKRSGGDAASERQLISERLCARKFDEKER